MNRDKILKEEEILYENLLGKIEDKAGNEYKRIYRKLYYIRNMDIIKNYQKEYYRNKKNDSQGLKKNELQGFKIEKKKVTIYFD